MSHHLVPLAEASTHTYQRIVADDPRLTHGITGHELVLDTQAIAQSIIHWGGYEGLTLSGESHGNAKNRHEWHDIYDEASNAIDIRNGWLTIACGNSLEPDTSAADRAKALDRHVSAAALNAIMHHNVQAVWHDREPSKRRMYRAVDAVMLGGFSTSLTFLRAAEDTGDPFLYGISVFGACLTGYSIAFRKRQELESGPSEHKDHLPDVLATARVFRTMMAARTLLSRHVIKST